jgi:hypothetical protein
MRCLCWLVELAACGSPQQPAALSHRHTGRVMSVPILVGWRVLGDAHYTRDALALERCGPNKSSTLERTFYVPAGTWRLRAQYAQADCTAGVHVHVAVGSRPLASVAFSSIFGTAEADFELAFGADIALSVRATGSADCCGPTELYAIDLVQ